MILRLYKKTNWLKDFFKKPSIYGVVHIERISSTRATGIATIFIKILEVDVGKSILDNSKLDKTIED